MTIGSQPRKMPKGRDVHSLRGLFSRLSLIAVAALLTTGCFVSERGSDPGPDDSKDRISLNIRVGVGSVKALGKSSTITLNKLVLVFTSNTNDTIRDTITSSTSPALNTVATSSQNISKSYTLKALRTWKVIATSRDTRDSIIHLDSATVPALYAGYTANVNLSLASRFSMYEAKFLTLPDSIESATPSQPKQKLIIYRLVLKLNGLTIVDSIAPPPKYKFDSLATHVLSYDYIRTGTATLNSGTTRVIRAVEFPTADTGYMVGDSVVLKTVNGGQTWTSLSTGGTNKVFHGLSFRNGRTGVIVGGKDSLTIRRTTDGGATWAAAPSAGAADVNYKYRSVHLVNDTGWAVSAHNSNPSPLSGYVRTVDAGATWTLVTPLPQANAVRGINGTTAWAVGPGGLIRKNTTGAGDFATSQTSGTVRALNSVFPVNANLVYAVGDTGTILRTTNGGANWVTKTSGTTSNLNSVWFFNAATGFAVGDAGKVFRTVDSGNTWASVSSPTMEKLLGLTFYSGRGYAVGANGTLLTLNSGYMFAEMMAYGPMGTWDVEKPLFYGSSLFAFTQGTSDTIPLTLNWVGPSTGTGTINATIGKVGKINIIGNLPGTNL
jgi:photosystem II stability/assembly factor-like uncharacterized protein